VIQEKSPFIVVDDENVKIPLYLLIEKWILAYYPIFESNLQYSQINGLSVKLAFESEMIEFVKMYQFNGGISIVNVHLKTGFPSEYQNIALKLIKKLRDVITTNPMRYIGSRLSNSH
jgi:hypothetical protein